MTTKKELEQARSISAEHVQEAARDFESRVNMAVRRIETLYPNLIFQEKHETGFLWWKRIHYRYYKYCEGSMVVLGIYSSETINNLERW